MTINEFRELFGLPPVEGGDKLVIRKEYTDLGNLGEGEDINENRD
jgi:hypothetical protein